jgi:hypothetical protein
MSAIIDFYKHLPAEGCRHVLSDTWGWSFDRLEREHDYIQWWFPLEEPSAHNPDAPLLTEEDIEEFQSNAELQARALNSVHTFMRFLFFRKNLWARGYDHNQLRITRMLKFVNRVFTNSALPEILFAEIRVMVLSVDGGDELDPAAMKFWMEAVYGPPEEEE